MPTAKRQKKSNGKDAAQPAKPLLPTSADDRPTIADIEGESEFAQLARKHWLKTTKRATKVKVKHDVVKRELWDVLDRDNFRYKSLLVLEGLQTLESYLWPGYTDESSNHHVLLIVLLVNVKRREQLESWGAFEDRPDDFSGLFRRILSLTLDQTLTSTIRTQLVSFFISAFQSLDCAIVRKECAPLVSISVWHNLSSDALREMKLEQNPQARKTWRASAKRYDAADEATKARLRFDRSWLYTLVLDFVNLLYDSNANAEQVLYCERFAEFLIDLLSQLPTRRYVNSLLVDLHLMVAMKLAPLLSENNGLLQDLRSLLNHYTYFTIDDQTGAQLSHPEAFEKHCSMLARLQRVALKHFKDKLTVLALSNYGSIDKREELEALLEPLTNEELAQLAHLLHLRTAYPDQLAVRVDRKFLLEVFSTTYERRRTFQEVSREMSLVPTELSLFEGNLVRAEQYDGSHPLAMPKLNLQYLSVGDFLWRSLVLARSEAFYSIRKDIETVVRRLRLEDKTPGGTRFPGFSKMAMPCSKASILEVVPALVGDDRPSVIRAEVSVDVRRLNDSIRREWDSLRTGDVVFLLALKAPAGEIGANGESDMSEAQSLGVVGVRTAEVLRITDDKGRAVRDAAGRYDSKRIFQLKLDPRTYIKDAERTAAGKPDIHEHINVIMRRSGRENNFKPVLESIRSLTLSDVPLASWLHEVFLGYGDPAGATYKQLPNQVKAIDYRDTFLDWQHLIESLPGKIIEPSEDASGSFGPPYVLESMGKPPAEAPVKPSKKRRRDAEPALLGDVETWKVSTYKPPNMGPYPQDIPKMNSVRFTAAQIEAIASGSQPGLTVIVGPPGTGKTDVATQIINNIYHNFPNQKTLLIAHSNQALNQLFAKIVALDIDERHLLRLGRGEEDLYTDSNFSKHGRVESFLDNRDWYLQEVNQLAASIGAPGAHGNSAETAGYFNSVYIEAAWAKYAEVLNAKSSSVADIVKAFPFHGYFSSAPQPLFPPQADRETAQAIAEGCQRHISKIFSELADVMPFEILRRDKDKSNYLLTNEARIIAMTSTHAAMNREEIASLGFRYDNVVMEEAAQITEIENFLPLAMQKPRNGQMPLQRVVLCGDHLQNSPVIQSHAFRHYANLEQSLFSRLVRLGVPTINLDQQGRARPSIANLYRWRYTKLDDLPHVQGSSEFLQANAGFKYDYQFINVPDYKGRGEAEPSPHFIQNLGEAEYAVALYQYMRLLGYPASNISILTTYAGQRALIRDVLAHRCANKAVFGQPKIVTTVDKYQGEQNDYVILSLTRTSRVGFLRDIRRMTVALSRARLGLYILGRREVFEACYELREAFEQLLQRPDKLMLVTGELWPSQRAASGAGNQVVPGEVCMEGVEHLGQYVYEMTNTKIGQLQADDGAVPAAELLASIKEEDNGYAEPDEEEEVEETGGGTPLD